MITFGLYGSGWRSEYFLRVAKLLPHQFHIDGIVTRSEEKSQYFKEHFGVDVYGTLADYLKEKTPLFIVESVNKGVSESMTNDILNQGIPVLMETPAGKDMESMIRLYERVKQGAKIQIAEQYPDHPQHVSRHRLVAKGLLGEVGHVHVSFSHGYHNVALMRQLLGITFENVRITARSFPVNVANGVSRTGIPTEDNITEQIQTVATLQFDNGKTGIYNFEMNQHRSWVRTPLIQVKGTHGEIFNETVKYLMDYQTPVEMPLMRINMGENQNVEGFGFKGILMGDRWLYKNPYLDGRLSDDEIAVATILEKMAHYVLTDEPFYDFALGCQDMYIGMLIEESAKLEEDVVSTTQIWAK